MSYETPLSCLERGRFAPIQAQKQRRRIHEISGARSAERRLQQLRWDHLLCRRDGLDADSNSNSKADLDAGPHHTAHADSDHAAQLRRPRPLPRPLRIPDVNRSGRNHHIDLDRAPVR